jgi:transposase
LQSTGHKGHSRFLYEPEDCTSVLDHHPETCSCCGEKLTGVDAFPYRHQVVDIPPIKPIVVEHRLHQLVCEICGASTRAFLPLGVNPSGYETRVVALVAVLSGAYRHSQRMVPPLCAIPRLERTVYFYLRSLILKPTLSDYFAKVFF